MQSHHHSMANEHLTVRSFFPQWWGSSAADGGPQLRDLLEAANDDPMALWQIAAHSLRLEEAVTSGCLMIQAIALVRVWVLLNGGSGSSSSDGGDKTEPRPTTVSAAAATTDTTDALHHLDRASLTEWRRAAVVLVDTAAATDTAATGPTPSRSSTASERLVRWRASFAIKLYAVFDKPIFSRLEQAILGVCISLLRALEPRFWHADSPELFIDVLQLVKRAGWGKHLVCGAIQGWSVSLADTDAIANEDTRRQILAHFAERVRRHLGEKATKKLVRNQHAILSREERDRLAPASVASHIKLLTEPTMAAAVEAAVTTAATTNPDSAAATAAATSSSVATRELHASLFSSSSLFALVPVTEAPYWERQVDVLPVDAPAASSSLSSSTRTTTRLRSMRHAASIAATVSPDATGTFAVAAAMTVAAPAAGRVGSNGRIGSKRDGDDDDNAMDVDKQHDDEDDDDVVRFIANVATTARKPPRSSHHRQQSQPAGGKRRQAAASSPASTSLRSTSAPAPTTTTKRARQRESIQSPRPKRSRAAPPTADSDSDDSPDATTHVSDRAEPSKSSHDPRPGVLSIRGDAGADVGCSNDTDDPDDTDDDGEDESREGDAGGELPSLELLDLTAPLNEAAPFHPAVAARLRTDDMVVVQPCFREHAAWIRELNADLLQPRWFKHGIRMSLGCVNDGCGYRVPHPACATTAAAAVAASDESSTTCPSSPPVRTSSVFDFIEKQWSYMAAMTMAAANPNRATTAAPTPPPGTTDRVYYKDLSQLHDIRRACVQQRNRRRIFETDDHDQIATSPPPATSDFGSFFPKWDRLLDEYDEQVEVRSAAAAWCAAAAAAAATQTESTSDESNVEAAKSALRGGTAAAASSPAAADTQDLYAQQRFPALFLDAYARHPKSLLRLVPEFCDGVSHAYAYLKHGFQMFNLHVEQWLLPFVHHQLSGQSVWIIVSRRDRIKLQALTEEMARVYGRHLVSHSASRSGSPRDKLDVEAASLVAPVLFYSKSLFPPPSLLARHGIHYRRIVLEAGQMLIAHGGCAHYGFSTRAGETYSFACNVVDEHWLVSGGPEYVLQHFEWVMDLAELEPTKLQSQLAAYGMEPCHLRASLNCCPPAFTCQLLKAIRDDLQAHVGCVTTTATNTTPPPPPTARDLRLPRIPYTLSLDDIRAAIATINDVLAVLHHSSVRGLLQRAYVDDADASTHLCQCHNSKNDDDDTRLDGNDAAPWARRLHNCMERVSQLVVGSGQQDADLDVKKRGRTRSTTDGSASDSRESESPSPRPVSTVFGSVTATPLARLLDYLASDNTTARASLRLQATSRFVDIGSGIGQVVMHVQLRFALASCVGIECVPDRCEAAEQTLAQFQLQRHARDNGNGTGIDARYVVPGLAPVLDDRLDRIRFLRGCIEDHLDLVSDATHVFMFDCCFHPNTHAAIIARLCDGTPRIVVSCLTRRRLQYCCPANVTLGEIRRRFRLLRRTQLTLAGSGSTRKIYIYQTS